MWCTSSAPASRLKYFEDSRIRQLAVHVLDPDSESLDPLYDHASILNLCSAAGTYFVYVLTKCQ